MNIPEKVSVHGGHSGQFCNHAKDSLEEIVKAYIEHGFSWVGITEHIPPSSKEFLYPDEIEAGLTVELISERFGLYMEECRRLQKKYRSKIILYAGMEIETCKGYERFVTSTIDTFKPDYIVGSVHHVDDMPIDYSKQGYSAAVEKFGGIENLYCRYFDQQNEMLKLLRPAVVGHFDLIRIYDPEYIERLKNPEIFRRIERNLDTVKELGLILDYNLRSLLKGADEPYVSEAILQMALKKNIAVVPGDDSHGVDLIGLNIDRAIVHLQEIGFTTDWQKPRLY